MNFGLFSGEFSIFLVSGVGVFYTVDQKNPANHLGCIWNPVINELFTISSGYVARISAQYLPCFIWRLETPVSPGALGHLEPSFFEAGRWVVSTVGAVVIPRMQWWQMSHEKRAPGCSFGYIRDYHKHKPIYKDPLWTNQYFMESRSFFFRGSNEGFGVGIS